MPAPVLDAEAPRTAAAVVPRPGDPGRHPAQKANAIIRGFRNHYRADPSSGAFSG